MPQRRLSLLLGLIVCSATTSCKRRSVEDSDVEMTRGILSRGAEPFVGPFVSLNIDVGAEAPAGCSGVLLGPLQVLTAAHCAEPAKLIDVISFDQKLKQTVVKASAWQMHPDWKKFKNKGGLESSKGDLAIVVLSSAVSGPFAKISASRNYNVRGAVYVGIGLREGNQDDNKVRYAMNIDASSFKFRPEGGTWLSRGAAVLCKGDSGGPLFASDGGLIGIASSVEYEPGAVKTCGKGKKAHHADVQENIVWIVCSFAKAGHPLAGYPIPSAESCL